MSEAAAGGAETVPEYTTEGHWAHSLAGNPYTMVWIEATS